MLGLKLATDPRWVNIVEKEIEEILTDHAYCEQKAATSCITLIVNYSYMEGLVETLSPIVSEEWGHFRMVLAELKKRGFELGMPRKDDYVNELLSFLKKGGSREEQLIDKLLMNALIEARSCERFRLLSLEIADDDLKEFYHSLMSSEAGHYRTFIDLAKKYGEEKKVLLRWDDWLDFEKNVLQNWQLRGDRVH